MLKKIRRSLSVFFYKSNEDNIQVHAASLAFVSVIALIPAIALSYYLLDFFGAAKLLRSKIEFYLFSNIAPSFSDEFKYYISQMRTKISKKTIGTIAIIGFTLTCFSMLSRIEIALNNIWGSISNRNIFQKIKTYSIFILLLPFMVGFPLFYSTKLVRMFRRSKDILPKLAFLLASFIPYILSSLFFCALFYFLPNTHIRKRDCLKAGFITGFVFEMAKISYAFYAARHLDNSIYGTLAILLFFLIWLYTGWYIVLAGAQLNYFIEQKNFKGRFIRNIDLLSSTLLLDIVESISKAPSTGISLWQLSKSLSWDRREVAKHLNFLIEKNWLVLSKTSVLGTKRYFLSSRAIREDLAERIYDDYLSLNYEPKGQLGKEFVENKKQALASRAWKHITN